MSSFVSDILDADLGRPKPERRPNESVWWTICTLPLRALIKLLAIDIKPDQSTEELTGVSCPELESAEATRRRFIDLQSSYIQNCGIESTTSHPRLDDIVRYGVSEAQQAKLWELETERLAAAIERGYPQNPLKSAIDEKFVPDQAGFELLSSVAREATRNIDLCDLDNKIECQQNPIQLEEISLLRTEFTKGRQAGISGGKVSDMSGTTITISADQKRKFYCFLVDYVSAVVAIGANHDAGYDPQKAVCITSLARCAAKLKFLVIDSEGFASHRPVNAQNHFDLGSTRIDKMKPANFDQNFSASAGALEVLRSIFQSLKCETNPGVLNDASHVGITVYEGWQGVPIMLSQDQYGHVRGASIGSALRNVSAVFHSFHRMRDYFGSGRGHKDQPPWSGDASMFIKYSMGSHEETALLTFLDTLTDVVLCMVPLFVMQHIQMPQFEHASRFFGESPDHGHYGKTTVASATAQLQVSSSSTITSFSPAFASPFLSKLTSVTYVQRTQTGPSRKDEMPHDNVFRDLVIENKAVVVKLRLYVIMTMVVCGILVVGGILAAFLVGERIPGVDPFNIATFAWILAAFIILIAKAAYVREWPWYDFLRGQLYCGSVSSLSAITGVDEQDILKYLLANDPYAYLNTRGPFNRLFIHRSEDGFSIDTPMTLRTLRDSGIVVVEVETNKGPALVCLDLRRGAEGRTTIRQSDGPREGERLIGCFDFSEDLDNEVDVRLHTLSRSMTWRRIRGIYNDMDKKFR